MNDGNNNQKEEEYKSHITKYLFGEATAQNPDYLYYIN